MHQNTINRIRQFVKDCDWEQFHTPVNEDEIVNTKMDLNEAKYPVEKARGNSVKYTELK